jgi:hypothetical protein
MRNCLHGGSSGLGNCDERRTVSAKRLAATAVVVAATIATTGVRGLASTGPATISITDRQLLDKQLGSGMGAREIVRTALFEHGGQRRRLGQASMLCTYVSDNQRSCTTTFTLPRGTIVVSGVLSTRLLYELAIVGGTGLYDNARGTLTNTAIKLRPRSDLLLFRLTG